MICLELVGHGLMDGRADKLNILQTETPQFRVLQFNFENAFECDNANKLDYICSDYQAG